MRYTHLGSIVLRLGVALIAVDAYGQPAYLSSPRQLLERTPAAFADWLQTNLTPRGVGVVVEAEHMCMTLRGVRADGTSTITSTLLGALREDPRSRAEFLALSATGAAGRPGTFHG